MTGRPGGVPGQSDALGRHKQEGRGLLFPPTESGALSGFALAVAVMPRSRKRPSRSRRPCGIRRRRGDASAAGGVPTRAASGTGRAGEVDASTVLFLPRRAGPVVRGRAGGPLKRPLPVQRHSHRQTRSCLLGKCAVGRRRGSRRQPGMTRRRTRRNRIAGIRND